MQKKEKKQYGITSVFYALNSVKAYIKNLSDADVQEVKYRKWENINGSPFDFWFCSECDISEGYAIKSEFNYCPNCGAEMDGKEC